MSETAAADLYAALEETAALLDVTCSRETVWPILTAFQDAIPQAVIALRVAGGTRSAGEFNCHFMMLPSDVDPYALAVSRGLIPATDHPVGSVLSDLAARCPIDSHGIDFSVRSGFKKTWAIFPPDDLQKLSDLAELPSMPDSLGEHIDFFAKRGLDSNVSLVGMDYRGKTVNLYFGKLPDGLLEPDSIRAAVRELGLPEPSEQLLRLGQQAFGVYCTLRWDSPKVERFCFSIMTQDPLTLPAQLDPQIEHFVRVVKHDAAHRKLFYAALSAAEGEFYKIQSYYQWIDRTLNLMQLAKSA